MDKPNIKKQYYGYFCRVCHTNTKDEMVKKCNKCNYEVCMLCSYDNNHNCNQ